MLRTYRGLGRPHSSADLVPRLLLAPVRPRARPTAVGQDDARRGRHFRRGQDRRGRVRRFMCARGNPFEARIAGDCQVRNIQLQKRYSEATFIESSL